MKTPQSFSTHKKFFHYITFSFRFGTETNSSLSGFLQDGNFWGKFFSSFCQLSWKINDCLSRSMPGLSLGYFGWDQLEDCLPTRRCHKTPLWLLLDSSRGPARRRKNWERWRQWSVHTDPHTASSAAANYGNSEEIPLLPWDPPTAVQLPQGQAEFCKQALKSSSCSMHAITAFVICSFIL